MDVSHDNDQLFLYFRRADDFEILQKVIRYSNQSILRPLLEPIHCHSGYETRELQCSRPEFSSYLLPRKIYFIFLGCGSRLSRVERLLTGEKQSTTCRLFLARDIKKSYRLSCVGTLFGSFFFMTGISSFVISSSSSLANKFATSPALRTLFRYSRKASSLISLSVKMNVMPCPSKPATLYRYFRSS